MNNDEIMKSICSLISDFNNKTLSASSRNFINTFIEDYVDDSSKNSKEHVIDECVNLVDNLKEITF